MYLGYVFQVTHGTFWTMGLGDWLDPYFINALMEHWFTSLTHLTDPTSPPMFFPVHGTLGYSHGLALYAPYYVALLAFLHPFQAYNLMLVLVIETGLVCLYLLLRRLLGLSFIESFLLSAFFATSGNVMNGALGVWTPRPSVFLIPPALLLALVCARMRAGPAQWRLAFVSGLLITLLFVQDFYTAQLAALFVILAGIAVAVIERKGATRALARAWTSEPSRMARVACVMTMLAAVWTLVLAYGGGIAVRIGPLRIASNDWRRPAVLTLVAAGVCILFSDGAMLAHVFRRTAAWKIALLGGAAVGTVGFLWIYASPYREHSTFAEADLVRQLVPVDLRWPHPDENVRSFTFAIAAAIIACLPWLAVDRTMRRYCAAFTCLSVLTFALPLRFGTFSIWQTLVAPLPGFSAIRDPTRISYLYELVVVLSVAAFMSRMPARSSLRVAGAMLVAVLLVAVPNTTQFAYGRSNGDFDRWVEAPIRIAPACQSFFIRPVSRDSVYRARSAELRPMYAIDATFIAMHHSVPTLNGYSAWEPRDWRLSNPDDPGYGDGVKAWIDRNRMVRVCELDVETRTMTSASPR